MSDSSIKIQKDVKDLARHVDEFMKKYTSENTNLKNEIKDLKKIIVELNKHISDQRCIVAEANVILRMNELKELEEQEEQKNMITDYTP